MVRKGYSEEETFKQSYLNEITEQAMQIFQDTASQVSRLLFLTAIELWGQEWVEDAQRQVEA